MAELGRGTPSSQMLRVDNADNLVLEAARNILCDVRPTVEDQGSVISHGPAEAICDISRGPISNFLRRVQTRLSRGAGLAVRVFLIFLIFFYVQGPTPPSTNTHTRTHARTHTQVALVGAADAHMRYRCVTDSVSAVACVPLCAGFTVAELVSGFGGPGPGRNGVRTGVSRQRRRPGLPRVRGKSWEAPDPV